jgi:hypothetical protein
MAEDSVPRRPKGFLFVVFLLLLLSAFVLFLTFEIVNLKEHVQGLRVELSGQKTLPVVDELRSRTNEARDLFNEMALSFKEIQSLVGQVSDQTKSLGIAIESNLKAARELNRTADWRESFVKAQEAKKDETKRTLATYYYLNALAKDPGNLEILSAYADYQKGIADNHQEQKNFVDAYDVLQSLESFLRVQVQFLPSEAVESFLKDTIDKISEEKAAVAKLEAPEPQSKVNVTEKEKGLRDKYELLKAGNLKLEVPSDVAEVEKTLKEREELLELARSINENADSSPHVQRLEGNISTLRGSALVQRSLEQTQRWMDKAKGLVENRKDLDAAAYYLQNSENSLRQLLGFEESVLLPHETRIQGLLVRLKDQSRELAAETRNNEAQKPWAEFESQANSVLNLSTITANDNPPEPDKICQTKLDALNGLLQGFQQVLPTINGTKYEVEAKNKISEITGRMEELSANQQKRYTRWAMSEINVCLKKGNDARSASLEEKRIRTNKVAVGKAIIDHLGKIDPSLLPLEASRSYSEVYEALFQALAAPESEKDFDEPGFKLNVLSEVLKKPKYKLRDF